MALREAGDDEGLRELRELLRRSDRREFNLHLQAAAVAGDEAYLREIADIVRDSPAPQETSVENLTLALVTTGHIDEALGIAQLSQPEHFASVAVDSAKRFAWALALAGRFDQAIDLTTRIGHPEERARALYRIAIEAVRRNDLSVVERVADACSNMFREIRNQMLSAFVAKRDPFEGWHFAVSDLWRLYCWWAAVFVAAGRDEQARQLAEEVCSESIVPAEGTSLAFPTRYTRRQKEHVQADVPSNPDAGAIEDVTALIRENRLEDARARAENISAAAERAKALATIAAATTDAEAALVLWLTALIGARRVNRGLVGAVIEQGKPVLSRAGYAETCERLDQIVASADAVVGAQPPLLASFPAGG